MANIQQSINSMLSSAQGAAFLFSQTPYYKQQAEVNALKAQSERLSKADETLNEAMENVDENTPNQQIISQYEISKDLDKEIYANQMELYKQTGKEEYLTKAQKYTPAQRQNWDELIEEANQAAKAGQKAQTSYNNKTNVLRDTIDKVRENKEFLSAKQRGQLETMIHTLDKKGALK